MNGYSYKRMKDEEIHEAILLALGLDQNTPGIVMVDLVIPHLHGAYRFTVPQFDQFAHAVVNIAKLSQKMDAILDCVSHCIEGEEQAVIERVMRRMGDYLIEYTQHEGGIPGDITTVDEEES